MEKVLVTGATGYIGLHCIHQLLNQGYAVNGSVRSPERKDEIINALKSNNTSTDHLNLYTFNLTEDDGWDEGMQGCDFLLHVASPISLEHTDEEYFVQPAVDGVKRALTFAQKHGVKKVVLTSSVAAIFDTMEKKTSFNESDWSDINNPAISAYSKSKTLAEKAAWEFVKKLPKGLDTLIGERGIRLSMGEKQRLTLARAILKSPPIVILDEATSSVDVDTERKIQLALNQLIKDRTTLIIAHRLSTIREADQIIFLKHGEIVEQGSHDQLLDLNGSYANFCKHQESLIPQGF